MNRKLRSKLTLKKKKSFLVFILGFLFLVSIYTFKLPLNSFINKIDSPSLSEQSVSPVKLGNYTDFSGYAYRVYVSGDIAYIADTTDGFEIVNVSDPSNTYEVGDFYQGGPVRDWYVSG